MSTTVPNETFVLESKPWSRSITNGVEPRPSAFTHVLPLLQLILPMCPWQHTNALPPVAKEPGRRGFPPRLGLDQSMGVSSLYQVCWGFIVPITFLACIGRWFCSIGKSPMSEVAWEVDSLPAGIAAVLGLRWRQGLGSWGRKRITSQTWLLLGLITFAYLFL